MEHDLVDYNPTDDVKAYSNSLKKDLSSKANPYPSVANPAGSKTDKSNKNDKGDCGCCVIS